MTFLLAANSTSTINDVEPGLLGFLVVAVLGLALVFLLRSMNKQFRKIGPKPEETEAEGASEAVRQRPLRGLAAHRAAMAAAEANDESATGSANSGPADASRE
ncbi:MAG TPA: hypothetical protein VHT26_23885 [Trebonia sp.]|nr:hypothetical protein [Trebonia sp.]